MKYSLKGHAFEYEVQTVIQIFYPNEKYIISESVSNDGVFIESAMEDGFFITAVYENGEKASEYKLPIGGRQLKMAVKLSVFNALKNHTGLDTPWGALTGIRPTKMVFEMWECGLSDEEALAALNEEYQVSVPKAKLCVSIAHKEKEIIKNNTDKKVSLYIGIPFCPTKCLYCSFTSYPLAQSGELVWPYLKALVKELEYLKEITRGLSVETVYIGGGTPTVLDASQLEYLLKNINFKFEKEFSVEAGRPDTLTHDKLRLLKDYGVNRISVNPQTMNGKTLRLIGREHTPEQFLDAFRLARQAGHENINIDLIVGLPGETPEDVSNTMDRIKDLAAESITVHTLAIKRASRLKEDLASFRLADADCLEKMLDITREYTGQWNMYPYYMYRQKNMLGNFENVGYCREGFECVYNVQIMEERQTILAAGAGGITKVVDTGSNRIDRIFNVKDVNAYIDRIDEMIERKKGGLKWS